MKRVFIESSIGQLHARKHNARAGNGIPLLMLHAAPGGEGWRISGQRGWQCAVVDA
jgi:hypothetical protein